MRARLAASLAVLVVGLALAPADAAYVGTVRSARAVFSVRGIDGHSYRLGLEVRGSGLGGTEEFHQLRMTVARCARDRCGPPASYVRSLAAGEYHESFDLAITRLSVPFGALRLLVEWSAGAGWGPPPPAVGTTDGVRATTGQPARATLLVGNDVRGGLRRYARCVDGAAAVSSGAAATPGAAVQPERWPAATPAGLAVTPDGRRHLGCG